MHRNNGILLNQRKIRPHRKIARSHPSLSYIKLECQENLIRRKIHSTNLEQRPWILVKLSFIVLSDSKLSGLHPFNNMVIIHQLKIGKKQKSKLCVHDKPIREVILFTLTESSCIINKWHLGILKIFTLPERAVWKHFHVWHAPLFWLPPYSEANLKSYPLFLRAIQIVACKL